MKKVLIFALAAILSVNAADGQAPQRKVYCLLLGKGKFLSEKVNVEVDFGQNPYSNSNLVDENGKRITFNSMVDAMNYMGKFGWEFENAYAITIGSGKSARNVYHWLLSKHVSGNEDANNGFTTKQQFKDKQREQGRQRNDK